MIQRSQANQLKPAPSSARLPECRGRAGELLIEAKERVGHGHWLEWLEGNVEFSDRTARLYMRVAERWPELENQNGNALPIREAEKILRKPRPKEPDGKEQIEPRRQSPPTARKPTIPQSAPVGPSHTRD